MNVDRERFQHIRRFILAEVRQVWKIPELEDLLIQAGTLAFLRLGNDDLDGTCSAPERWSRPRPGLPRVVESVVCKVGNR